MDQFMSSYHNTESEKKYSIQFNSILLQHNPIYDQYINKITINISIYLQNDDENNW